MARRLNWKKANLKAKPALSIKDEAGWHGRDRAARWLERVEARLKAVAERRLRDQHASKLKRRKRRSAT